MKWLTNLYDPRLPDAKYYVARRDGETRDEAWQRRQSWLIGKTIGEPKSANDYSLEQLKSQNIVGVYSNGNH